MKFAVDEGERRALLFPADGGGECRLKRLAWLSLEDMAAVFRRMASCRRMEEAGRLAGGCFRVGETLGETTGVAVWGLGGVISNFDKVLLSLSSVLLGSFGGSFLSTLICTPFVTGSSFDLAVVS